MTDGIECCEIMLKDVDGIKFRLDAEYYQKAHIKLFEKIKSTGFNTLNSLKIKIDCSAFYPAITDEYKFNFEGIPFIRVNDIQNGFVQITDKTAFLGNIVLERNEATIAKCYAYDIVIAKGGNTLAKVGLIPENYPQYAICRDVVVLRTSNLPKSHIFYIWAFLFSNHGYQLMLRTASQTGQPHLTLPSLAEMPIPKIKLNFISIIEKLFISAQSYSEEANTSYKKAEKMLLDALGLSDFRPIEKKVAIKNLSDSFGSSGRLDAEYYQTKYDALFAKLLAVNTYLLGDLVWIKKSVEPGSDEYLQEGIPFVRVSDLSQYGLSEPEIHLSRIPFAHMNLQPKKDTILLSKDGSVGIAYKVEKDLDIVTSGAILHLVLKTNQFLPDYLTLVLNSLTVKMQAERDAGGSIIQHWKPSEIEKVVIPWLPIDKQEKISHKIQESFSLRKESKELLERAKQAVEIAIEIDEQTAMDWLSNLK